LQSIRTNFINQNNSSNQIPSISIPHQQSQPQQPQKNQQPPQQQHHQQQQQTDFSMDNEIDSELNDILFEQSNIHQKEMNN